MKSHFGHFFFWTFMHLHTTPNRNNFSLWPRAGIILFPDLDSSKEKKNANRRHKHLIHLSAVYLQSFSFFFVWNNENMNCQTNQNESTQCFQGMTHKLLQRAFPSGRCSNCLFSCCILTSPPTFHTAFPLLSPLFVPHFPFFQRECW